MDQVAERIAELRERRALTLRDLSAMSGVAADTINQIELGHRRARPSTLRKLARALEVSVEELYAETALPKARAPKTGQAGKEASIYDLVRMYKNTARLGQNIASRFTNLTKADVELLSTFDEYSSILAKMHGPRDIYGKEPEDLAEAIDELDVAHNALLLRLEEHADLAPDEERRHQLSEIRNGMKARASAAR